MLQIVLIAVLLLIGARLAMGKAQTPSAMGWLLVAAGIAVFAIRAQHAGPYAPPEAGNLRAALLALIVGAGLSMQWPLSSSLSKRLVRIALGVSPILFFFALYSTLAEVEEVVVLRATLPSGQANDLRLWVVDFDNAAWVAMPKSKADANRLIDTRAELLRDGELRCVRVKRFTDRERVDRVHALRHEKYFVQRLATVLGIFGETAKPNVIALELLPCSRG